MKKLIKFIVFLFILFIVFITGMVVQEDMDKNPELVKTDKSGTGSTKDIYYYQNVSDDTNYLELKLVFPLMDPADNVINDSIYNKIKDLITGFETKNSDYLKNITYENFIPVIDTFFDQLVDNYKNAPVSEERASDPDLYSARSVWRYDREIKILGNNDNFLSLVFQEIFDTGGAHPNGFRKYFCFDKKQKNWFDPKDRLTIEETDKLLPIAEKIFREIREIPENQTFEDAGFWFDNNIFKLSRSTCLTDTSFILYYNDYEVTNHANGPTYLEIPLSVLKKEGIEF